MSGIKQGDALSPIRFNLAIKKVIGDIISINHELERNGNKVVLAYADDIIILWDIKNNIVNTTGKLS